MLSELSQPAIAGNSAREWVRPGRCDDPSCPKDFLAVVVDRHDDRIAVADERGGANVTGLDCPHARTDAAATRGLGALVLHRAAPVATIAVDRHCAFAVSRDADYADVRCVVGRQRSDAARRIAEDELADPEVVQSPADEVIPVEWADDQPVVGPAVARLVLERVPPVHGGDDLQASAGVVVDDERVRLPWAGCDVGPAVVPVERLARVADQDADLDRSVVRLDHCADVHVLLLGS